MNKLVFLFSLCLTSVYSAVSYEEAPVSAKESDEGYGCKSSNKVIGLMKSGEVRINYRPNFCGQARCSGGSIDYQTCGIIQVEGCDKMIFHYTKPYPDCCTDFTCV